MKIASILAASVLAASAFAVQAAETQTAVKAPVLMTDAEMTGVVAGNNAGPGYGICTAVGKAHAPGAIKNFGPNATINLPGNGNLNSKGNAPGFGQQTAGHSSSGCGIIPS